MGCDGTGWGVLTLQRTPGVSANPLSGLLHETSCTASWELSTGTIFLYENM